MKELLNHPVFRQWDGPQTRDLALGPSQSGIGQLPQRLQPDSTTTMVCGFCSTGCGLNIHLKEGKAINLSAARDYPVNLGMACPKGWEALSPLTAPDRATVPLLLNPANGKREPVSWSRAMDVFVERFKRIMAEHGPESVAFLSTGQICTEEMALLGALFKFGMGGIHGDSNTRQCMATAHVAYKQSFGFDAPPYTYADFEESDTLVFVGANPCIAHPILWQRVMQNRNQPEIIVIDPRKTETAMCASQHLAIKPKSDLVLFYGVASLLIQNGWIDRQFIERSTTGFDEFSEFVREFPLEGVAERTGLTVGQIFRFAESIHKGRAVSFWWTMGVNQGHESTRTAQAIINLALMTGNIGRPGTGANSITGQCNAMGSRLFSNTTSLLGGRDFLNPDHRKEVADILGINVDRIPRQNSLAYDQIIDGVREGRIKGLWIIGTNTAHSWIGRGGPKTEHRTPKSEVRDSELGVLPEFGSQNSDLASFLAGLDFLAVQDMYHTTETARLAHLLLPAAGWGEKEGTFVNSERRIGLVKKVAAAPGEALSDFNIFRLVAACWGCELMFDKWRTPEAVFQIMKELSRGRPCDITGIENYRMLDACGGIQWPITPSEKEELKRKNGATSSAFRERRLFEDGRFFTPDGRAQFLFDRPVEAPELGGGEYPFTLLTGRGTSAQWHTNTRTGKSAVLRQLYPANIYVEINPQDARRLRIRSQQMVEVVSRRGRLVASACITATVQSGQVFIPMHYEETNRLTYPAFDPHSRQPSYKACAVKLVPIGGGEGLVRELEWEGKAGGGEA